MDRLSHTSASSRNSNDGELPQHPLLFPFESNEFAHSQSRTAENRTATIGTYSHTVVIPDVEQAEVLDRIRSCLRSRPETGGGEFELPLRTRVIRAVVK